jgi:hypothetical protein
MRSSWVEPVMTKAFGRRLRLWIVVTRGCYARRLYLRRRTLIERVCQPFDGLAIEDEEVT